MPKEIFHDTFENLEITGICIFVRETMQADGKSCFFDTNASNFLGRCNRYF